jgi:hypothetical protein
MNPPAMEPLPKSASPGKAQKERYEQNKLAKRLRGATGRAIGDFNMIEATR